MHKIKLLVVDDEATDREFIKAVIKREQLPVSQVLEADNGLDAVRLSRKYRPDMVLMDIYMPGCDGLRAAEIIHHENRKIHIVIVSAYDDFEYARTAFRSGAADYLLKPVRPAEIANLTRRIAVAGSPEGEDRPLLIARVEQYVEMNAASPIQLKDIAAAVYVSPHYLSRAFKKLTGKSLIAYIQEVRLARAESLLAETALSVTEISGRVGFNDATYFATCFKKRTGMTPLDYRLLIRKGQDF